MTKKILFLTLFLLLLTGCQSEYKISIKDKKVKEEFVLFENDMNVSKEKDETGRNFEDYALFYGNEYDLFTSFYNLYADEGCAGSCDTYEKSYISSNDKIGFSLSHEFSFDEYGDSALANELFPGFEAFYDGRYLKIKGGNDWNFKNAYKNLDSIKITIETNYKVKTSNAKRVGNDYVWEVNKDDLDNLEELYILIDTKESVKNSNSSSFIYLILFLIALIVAFIIYVLVKKNKEQNTI